MALPAPWYTTLPIDAELPRLPSWNVSAPDHHWLVAQQPPLTAHDALAYVHASSTVYVYDIAIACSLPNRTRALGPSVDCPSFSVLSCCYSAARNLTIVGLGTSLLLFRPAVCGTGYGPGRKNPVPTAKSYQVVAGDSYAAGPPVMAQLILALAVLLMAMLRCRYNHDFQRRWRCLRSVDDMVAALHAEIARLGIADSTYIFASSDHGYHFGELRLPAGKWNVYDTDIRVPMRVTGPGITAGSTLGLVGSHVDLAPTWLGLAGIDAPPEMDGRSLVAGLIATETPLSLSADPAAALPASVLRHLRRPPRKRAGTGGGGESCPDESCTGTLPVGGAYVEYHGIGLTGSPGRLGDAFNNTYRALRVIDRRTPTGLGNVLYAEFGSDFAFDAVYAREFFDLDADPYQVQNAWSALAPDAQQAWVARIAALSRCKGKGCGMAPPPNAASGTRSRTFTHDPP